jgi:hypothetical protein
LYKTPRNPESAKLCSIGLMPDVHRKTPTTPSLKRKQEKQKQKQKEEREYENLQIVVSSFVHAVKSGLESVGSDSRRS